MSRKRLSPPDKGELESVLRKRISITRVATHYQVHFSTAKRWIREYGLFRIINSAPHRQALRELIMNSAKSGTRRKVDSDLVTRLQDEGDKKLLARAIVDEFTMRYSHKRCGQWERFALTLRLNMYDEPPVHQIADLIGRPTRLRLRKAKSGVKVPYWDLTVEGYRAFRVIQLVNRFMVGQKAFQATIALRTGPFSEEPVPMHKSEYKQNLMRSILGKL